MCVCRVVSRAVFAVVHGMWLMLGVHGDQEQPQWRAR